MNQCERLLRETFAALPYQRFGICACCRRHTGEDGRPLWLAGRVRSALICLECFDKRGKAAGRRLAA